MHIKNVLIVLSVFFALTLVFNGCNGTSDDTQDNNGAETSYDVTLEVTSPDFDTASISWKIGSDDGTVPGVSLPWTKEDTCGENVSLEIVAVGDGTTAEGDSITATIYIDGQEAATATGGYDSEYGETGVLLTTTSPSPD